MKIKPLLITFTIFILVFFMILVVSSIKKARKSKNALRYASTSLLVKFHDFAYDNQRVVVTTQRLKSILEDSEKVNDLCLNPLVKSIYVSNSPVPLNSGDYLVAVQHHKDVITINGRREINNIKLSEIDNWDCLKIEASHLLNGVLGSGKVIEQKGQTP